MKSTKAWLQNKARLISMPWLFILAFTLFIAGCFSDEHSTVFGLSLVHLKLLSLPMVLALMTGFFPITAPFNTDEHDSFWKITSQSFKLFFVMFAVGFLLFSLTGR